MTKTPNTPALSVVVRAHDPSRMEELRAAIASLHAQTTSEPVEIVLCTDGDWPDLDLAALVGPTQPAGPRPFQQIKIVYDGDSRVELLKLGIRAAKATHIAVLDFDDLWMPDAAERFLKAARATGAAVTFGAANLALVKPGADAPYRVVPFNSFPFDLLDLLRHNIVHISSFVALKSALLPHLDGLPNLSLFEDYYLLLGALSEGAAAWLPTPDPVSEYRVDLQQQASKYSDAAAAGWREIEALKARLTFPLSGEALRHDHASAPRQGADAALLGAISEGRDGAVHGVVEDIIALENGFATSGWCADLRAGTADLPAVFVEDEQGEFWLAPARWERRDVAETLGVADGRAGFARISPAAPKAVWAIAGTHKYRLDMPGETPRMSTKIRRRIWRLRAQKSRPIPAAADPERDA